MHTEQSSAGEIPGDEKCTTSAHPVGENCSNISEEQNLKSVQEQL